MNLKNLLVKLIKMYQLFISPILGNNCRYYPSCSEYAKLEFQHDNILRALFFSIKRIITCNQLYKGGIDHPIIIKKIETQFFIKKPKIIYWFIPTNKKNKYILIKAENE